MKLRPQITLVGAGPGDPELITIAGLKAIQSAKVILYDALASPLLLKEAKNDCELISVGKRMGQHAVPQEEINKLLVSRAIKYGPVVRLKGGDPIVFGRGYEELEYARKLGIAVRIVPGISSSTSAPLSINVPLTKKGVSESFWVVTGTNRNGKISSDITLAAKSHATVVVLMGWSKRDEIFKIFRQERGAFEYAAIVQNATLPEQNFLWGTIASLDTQLKQCDLKAPAVMVFGRVVNEAIFATQLRIAQSAMVP